MVVRIKMEEVLSYLCDGANYIGKRSLTKDSGGRGNISAVRSLNR